MRSLLVLVAVSSLTFSSAFSIAQQIDVIDPVVKQVDTEITAVTLYRGRASVSRQAVMQLDPGLYELHVTHLPETIQADTLQARANGGAKVLAVDFIQQATAEAASQQAKELDGKIQEIELALRDLQQKRALLQSQSAFLDAITVRATNDASERAGTEKLDLDALRRQMEFVSEERTKIIASQKQLEQSQKSLAEQLSVLQAQRHAIASGSNVTRTAAVTVAIQQAGSIQLDVSYLVSEASWQPAYNVRASLDGSTALVEYDAILMQRTGEDWSNVKLALSTAQPMLAANPPTLQPLYVDIREHDRGVTASEVRMRDVAAAAPPPPPPGRMEAEALEKWADDAAVGGSGPSITFQLPRPVTVHTNSQKQQRTRIATVDTHPKFVHVAVPMLTDAVYIRGELVNASAYQLLPGKASIFLGEDYIGPTSIESVAPNGDFKVHFGIDPSVQASRKLITKTTEATGLLSGGRRTQYEYKLAIDNGTKAPITVELWDRYPISRNGEIQVDLMNLTAPLSTDAYYTSEEQPQGLLKWILNVPSTAGQSPYSIGYGVQINRAKDVELTNLPE